MRRAALTLVLLTVACGRRTFTPCDIRDATCQQQLVTALGELRGPIPVTPSVVLRSEEELVAEATTSTTEDERLAFTRQNEILAGFDLAEPGLTLADQVTLHYDNVAAFYSSTTQEVTIIDRGQALDGPNETITFVHELVHAMQDVDGFIATAYAGAATTDLNMARRSIIEGEARLYEDLAGLDLFGWEVSDKDYAKDLKALRTLYTTRAANAGSQVYEASALFAYTFGASYLRPRYDRDGPAGIVQVYAELPSTSYAVMFAAEPTSRLGDDAIAVPGSGGTTVIADSLGAFNVRAWCEREDIWSSVCEHILDDGFTGILLDDGSLVGIWRLRCEPDTAESVASYVGGDTMGDDVVILRTSTGDFPNGLVITGWRALSAQTPDPPVSPSPL